MGIFTYTPIHKNSHFDMRKIQITKSILLLTTLILFVQFTESHAQQWKEVKNENDIKIFRAVNEETGTQVFKVDFYLETGDILAPIAMLKNVVEYPKWLSNIESAQMMEARDSSYWAYKFKVRVGPSLKYGYAKVKIDINKEQTKVHYKMRPKEFIDNSKHHDFKKIEDFKSDWYFTAMPDGKIKVEYCSYLITSSYLLDLMARGRFEECLFSTAMAMREKVTDQKYDFLSFSDINF